MTTTKPLYLDARSELRVRREGPSLTVEMDGRAPRWYPLRRLSRVVSRGPVRWEGAALLACLAWRLPVLFVSDEGTVLGVFMGRGADTTGLREHLDAAVAAPEWPERYESWCLAQQRRMLVSLHRALGWQIEDLRASTVRRRLDARLTAACGRRAHARMRFMLDLLGAEVAQALVQAGIGPELASGLHRGVSLHRDVTRLMGWPLRGRLLAAGMDPPGSLSAAAEYYHARLEAPLRRTLERVLARLWEIPI